MTKLIPTQELIYISESGLMESSIFGCIFKSVSVETGFNAAPSKMTITVLEKNVGDFTLKHDSIGDMQDIKIGELRMAGFIESYERTSISVQGSGLYTVQMKDARVVMQTAMIANFGSNNTGSWRGSPGAFSPLGRPRAIVRHNLISVSGLPASGSLGSEVNREAQNALNLADVIASLEGNVLYYGNREFELDLTDFANLVDSFGDGPSAHLVEGKTRSLVSIINEFTAKAGVDWYVETRKKGVSDDLWVISIKTTDRTQIEARDVTDVTLDFLSELHTGNVISRKDGFEGNRTLRRKFVFGGIQRGIITTGKLEDQGLPTEVPGRTFTIKPIFHQTAGEFWGFDEDGDPLVSPAFTMSSDPKNRIPTSVEEMQDALNGLLNGEEDLEKLRSLKRYMNTHWGRQFWYRIDTDLEVIPNGWWQTRSSSVPEHKRTEANNFATSFSSLYPHSNQPFNSDNMLKISTKDGRYLPFVQLNEFSVTSETRTKNDGTEYQEHTYHFIKWTPIVTSSHHILHDVDAWGDSRKYMRCSLTQFDRYVIVTLPVPLSRYIINEDTGEVDYTKIARHGKLDNVWIPMMHRGTHYGPWSSAGNADSKRLDEIAHLDSIGQGNSRLDLEATTLRERLAFYYGRVLSNMDKDLVPWAFGGRGVTSEVAGALLEAEGVKKADFKAEERVFLTGQLEVAGLPLVNLMQPISQTFGGGAKTSITEIFIRADANGITTRYTSAINSRGRSTDNPPPKEKRQRQEEEDIVNQQCSCEEDDFPDTLDNCNPSQQDDLMTSDISSEDELDNALDDPTGPPTGPSTGRFDFIYQKPDGGLGVITVKEGGPFYAVRRLNYQDIDPESFAGGLNSTGSYFLAGWQGVRNLAEPANSPGLLAVGTRVTVSIFSETDEHGPYLVYMEQTPQVFSPPPVPQE